MKGFLLVKLLIVSIHCSPLLKNSSKLPFIEGFITSVDKETPKQKPTHLEKLVVKPTKVKEEGPPETFKISALNDGKSMDDFVPSPQIPFFPTLSERGLHIPYSSSPLGKDRDETLQGYLSNSANVNSFDEFVVGDHYEVAGIDLKNHQIDGDPLEELSSGPAPTSGIVNQLNNDNFMLTSEKSNETFETNYPTLEPLTLSNLLLNVDPQNFVTNISIFEEDGKADLPDDKSSSPFEIDPLEPTALSSKPNVPGERFTTPLFYPESKQPVTSPQWELLYGVLETQPHLYKLQSSSQTGVDPNPISLDGLREPVQESSSVKQPNVEPYQKLKPTKTPKGGGPLKNSFGYANVLFSSVGQLMKLAKEEVKIRGEKRKIPRKPPRPQPFRALGLLTQKATRPKSGNGSLKTDAQAP